MSGVAALLEEKVVWSAATGGIAPLEKTRTARAAPAPLMPSKALRVIFHGRTSTFKRSPDVPVPPE